MRSMNLVTVSISEVNDREWVGLLTGRCYPGWSIFQHLATVPEQPPLTFNGYESAIGGLERMASRRRTVMWAASATSARL